MVSSELHAGGSGHEVKGLTFAVPALVLLALVSCQANSETKPVPTVFTGKVVAIIDGDSAKVLRDKKTIEVRSGRH